LSNVLLGFGFYYSDVGSDLFCCLLLDFGLTLLHSDLGIDDRILLLLIQLHVDDLQVGHVCIVLIQLLVTSCPDDLA
jgi:hypothetical protein